MEAAAERYGKDLRGEPPDPLLIFGCPEPRCRRTFPSDVYGGEDQAEREFYHHWWAAHGQLSFFDGDDGMLMSVYGRRTEVVDTKGRT